MYRSGLSSVMDQPVIGTDVHWYDALIPFGKADQAIFSTRFKCDYTPFAFTEECRIPSVQEILNDTSNYGANLSPANRAAAEQMAAETIAADDPANYNLLPATSINWYVVAGLAAVALWAFGRR